MSEEWKTAKLPMLYLKAQKALVACATVDECREWKSRMNAVASYARQTNDRSLMDKAVEIRNRARRRMGEILAGMDKKTGAHLKKLKNHGDSKEVGKPTALGRTALADGAGVSQYERKTALRVAAMPEKDFERRVKDPMLGQQKGKSLPFIICPHCGGKIIR